MNSLSYQQDGKQILYLCEVQRRDTVLIGIIAQWILYLSTAASIRQAEEWILCLLAGQQNESLTYQQDGREVLYPIGKIAE